MFAIDEVPDGLGIVYSLAFASVKNVLVSAQDDLLIPAWDRCAPSPRVGGRAIVPDIDRTAQRQPPELEHFR